MTRREYFDPLIAPPPLPIFAGEGARIHPGAKWKGFLCAGRDSVIMEGTMLEDCVVLDGTVVEKGVSARDAILFRGGIVEGED